MKCSIWYLLILCFLGCSNEKSNIKIIKNNGKVTCDSIQMIYIQDTLSQYNPLFYFQIYLSIFNKGDSTFRLKFNNLFSSNYNCDVICELPNLPKFKFYSYNFMLNKSSIVNFEKIIPNRKDYCWLFTPIVNGFTNTSPNYVNNIFTSLDSIKMYIEFTELDLVDSLNLICKHKSIVRITPPCIGKNLNVSY